MEIVKFGNLYLDDDPLMMDVLYKPNSDIRIGNTAYSESPIEWVKVHEALYVARRYLLSYISWSELDEQGFVYGREMSIDGRRYNVRLLQVGDSAEHAATSEWDAILNTAGAEAARLFPANRPFSGMDIPQGKELQTSIRKGLQGREWDCCVDLTDPDIVWRPVLELVDMRLNPGPEHVGLPLAVRCPMQFIRGRLVEVTSYDLILDCSNGAIVDLNDERKVLRPLGNGLIAIDRGQIMYVNQNI